MANQPTPLERFGAQMFDIIFERFCEGDWEIEVNDLIVRNALDCGLVDCKEFDPEEDEDPNGACEAGDPFYTINAAGRRARDISRGTVSA